jgi:hypothetical protein
MAKGPPITEGVEAVIAIVHRKHPKWKAPMVRNEVDYILHKEDHKLPPHWPSLSSVQKVLATVRKKDNKPNPEEMPWSTATLDSYPISPEALSIVLKMWKSRIEKGDTFTIREAKWVARLSRLLEDIEKLSSKASQYAQTELMFELIGHPFDSTELDRSLMNLPVGISDFKSFLHLLAEQREDQERGIKDGVDQIRSLIKEKKQRRDKSK